MKTLVATPDEPEVPKNLGVKIVVVRWDNSLCLVAEPALKAWLAGLEYVGAENIMVM